MNFALFATGLLILVSLFSIRFAKLFNIPLLISFIFIGILAGSEGIGKIYFDDPLMAQNIGSIALMLIIFAGGLETSKEDVKSVLYPSITLSTLGVFMTALFSGLILYFLTDFSLRDTMLFSAIISSTDAAAVMGVLSGTKIKKKVKSLVEIESGSNDPMAYALILFLLAFFQPVPPSISSSIIFLLKQIVLGGIFGYIFGKITIPISKYLHITREELLTIYLISIMFLCFSIASFFGANSYLAIYVAGILIGNEKFNFKLNTLRNMRLLTWFMQIGMFIMLGLLVFPSQLISYVVPGTLLSILLVIIVRFAVVFSLMIPFDYTWKEKVFISWAGLKGAVPIIFATMAYTENLSISHQIFNLTFYVVCFSVLIQGVFLKKIGNYLGVFEEDNEDDAQVSPDELEELSIQKIILTIDSRYTNEQIKDLSLPSSQHIISVKRNDEFLIPSGSLILLEGDTLLICKK
ncbi:MAG: potassium/proton antiporter [Fusobacteriaceae bacterium]